MTWEVGTHHAFREYIHLLSKICPKILINKGHIKFLLTEDRNRHRKFLTMKISTLCYLETCAIAQMKGLFALIKSYKRHICQKRIFGPLMAPQKVKYALKMMAWIYYHVKFLRAANYSFSTIGCRS